VSEVAGLQLPNVDAFIEAVESGEVTAKQIVAWAEKMETWTHKAFEQLAGHEGDMNEARDEIDELSRRADDAEAHVSALAQLIRDARRQLRDGTDLIDYVDEHELFGPEEVVRAWVAAA
jgi:uncharacterized coiled-coil DUF342 family protein